MEEIIDQKFSFSSITPYKSYCRLDSKGSSVNLVDDDFERIMNQKIDRQKPIRIDSDEDGLPVIDMSNIPIFSSTDGKMIEIEPKGTRKRKIMSFYTDKPVGDRVYLQYEYQNRTTKENYIYTTDDEVVKKYFGDPFAYIEINTYERSIRRHGDKITIKLYRQNKYRDVNWKFFKRSNSIRSLTINMVTGNFTTTTISTTPKHKVKRFRTNNFYELYDIIFNTSYLFNSDKNDFKFKSIGAKFLDVFNNDDFLLSVSSALEIEPFGDLKEFYSSFIRKFSYLKKIKTPDVYEKLLTEIYPTEKFLKKNDRKLVASILDFAGIKSKFTIKLFHEYRINIFPFVKLCYLFGDDYPKYLGNLRKEMYTSEKPSRNNALFPREAPFIISRPALDEERNRAFNVTDVEKENLIKFLNSEDSPRNLGADLMTYIYDHFNMINTLREYYPEIHFKAKTYSEFEVEHRYLSKIIATIKKGWTTEYVYKKELIEEIEQPLLIDQMLLPVCADDAYFYPTILKREEEFIDEGSFMHHCVASYSDNNRSIIISLRSKDSLERITCEFNIRTGEIVQAKYKCNAQPPEIFHKPLEELKQLVRKQVYKDTLQWEEKKKVNVVINGVEVVKPTDEPTTYAVPYYAPLPERNELEVAW
jgi:hypothetical protein